MKANSGWKVLETVRAAGLWIDAVSGNEVLRARRAGFPMGAEPPVVMLTVDVLRDNALTTVLRARRAAERRVAWNDRPGRAARLGLSRADRGARRTPASGTDTCSRATRGPSSEARRVARRRWGGCARRRREAAHPRRCTRTSAAGPEVREFDENMRRLVDVYASLLPQFPDVEAVNLGGGLPHPYLPGAQEYDLAWYRPVVVEAAASPHPKIARPPRPRRDRAGTLPRGGGGPARLPRQGPPEDQRERQGPGPRVRRGRRRLR